MMNEMLFLSLFHKLRRCFEAGQVQGVRQEIQIAYIAVTGGLTPVVDVITDHPSCLTLHFFCPVFEADYHRIQIESGISAFNLQNLYSNRGRALSLHTGLLGNTGYLEIRSILPGMPDISHKELERKLCCDVLSTAAARLGIALMPYRIYEQEGVDFE